jgi:acylphosphatase
VNLHPRIAPNAVAVDIRVRGRVQGVGFRPMVYRIARELGLSGEARNDPNGVLIRVAGDEDIIADLVRRLEREAPALARIDGIRQDRVLVSPGAGFRISESAQGPAQTEICPDAAICRNCAAEVTDPFQRRFRYAFANCTRCGPRLSIITGIPYDRGATAMAAFPLCEASAPNTTILPIGAFMPRRSLATAVDRGRGSSGSTAGRPASISIPCSTMSTPWPASCKKAKSSPSRVSAVISSHATRPIPMR